MQQTIGTGIDLRRIHMQGMLTILRVRSVVHYTNIVKRGLTRMFLVLTICTHDVRAIEVHIIDAVVLRTIDEYIRHIDISGTQLSLIGVIILRPDTDVVTTLQNFLKRIGMRTTTRSRRRIALRAVRDTTHTVYPIQFANLAVLDVKLISRAFAIPGNQQGRVLAMRINNHMGRFLDLRRVDLEIINCDRRDTQRIGGIGIHPDEDEDEGLLGQFRFDIDRTVLAGRRHKRDILPTTATAYEFLSGGGQRLTYLLYVQGKDTARSRNDLIDVIIVVRRRIIKEIRLGTVHDV